MKKIIAILSMALCLITGMNVKAQNTLFNSGSQEYDTDAGLFATQGNTEVPELPGGHGSISNTEAPLGDGALLLVGLGLFYVIFSIKKRHSEKAV